MVNNVEYCVTSFVKSLRSIESSFVQHAHILSEAFGFSPTCKPSYYADNFSHPLYDNEVLPVMWIIGAVNEGMALFHYILIVNFDIDVEPQDWVLVRGNSDAGFTVVTNKESSLHNGRPDEICGTSAMKIEAIREYATFVYGQEKYGERN